MTQKEDHAPLATTTGPGPDGGTVNAVAQETPESTGTEEEEAGGLDVATGD